MTVARRIAFADIQRPLVGRKRKAARRCRVEGQAFDDPVMGDTMPIEPQHRGMRQVREDLRPMRCKVMIGIGKPDPAAAVDGQIARKIDALAVQHGPERGRGPVGFHLDDPAAAFLAAIKMSIGRQRQTVGPIGEATDLVDAATVRIVAEQPAFENRGKCSSGVGRCARA